MPLSQTDPKLDYDGSWGDASKGWPAISFPTEGQAKVAYVVAWRDAKVPYGSYVLVGKELRIETLELKKLVELQLAKGPTYVCGDLCPNLGKLDCVHDDQHSVWWGTQTCRNAGRHIDFGRHRETTKRPRRFR